ncbi:MAG: hypothetical protein L3J96_08160, partial [Thermoplasmata archaeon]|nr:hypothetical protein [Thermoplasmata archaeon]
MTEPDPASPVDSRPRGGAFLDVWFPLHPPTSRSGRASDSPHEGAYWVLALAIAVAFAAEVEWIIQASPLPPGGDPGQWLSNSLPFAGLPYPSQVVPFSYPPLLFPLLGFLVRLGGGPIEGARLFLGLVGVLLGLATYMLARCLLRRPILALIAEGAVLIDAPFLRLFYFGAYPTLLGLVFFVLAVAFGVRFL